MTSTTSPQKTLFLLGPGLIGGSLLLRLKEERPDLKLYALSRSDEQAASLAQLGITPIRGSIDDHDLIAQWAAKADIIIHTVSADDDKGSFAIVEGIASRPKGSARVIYIHTSGNDELLRSAPGMADRSIQDKTLSDLAHDDATILSRFASDAEHRHVDEPLLKRLMNVEKEKEYNAVTSIMMPPLIYGVGSEPWKRLSIQTPMLAQAMIDRGPFVLPPSHLSTSNDPSSPPPMKWNAVWIHDLVEAYLYLLKHLESLQPGQQKTHFVFPAEPQPFEWRDHFQAVSSELKRLAPPNSTTTTTLLQQDQPPPRLVSSPQELVDLLGGKNNPYSPCWAHLVFGKENSFTSPDLLYSLGFRHTAKGVVDSILNGKELEGFIKDRISNK